MNRFRRWQTERKQLRQWRNSRRRTRLELLPVELMLRQSPRRQEPPAANSPGRNWPGCATASANGKKTIREKLIQSNIWFRPRLRDAIRKRQERAEKRTVQPLPATAPPSVDALENPPSAAGDPLAPDGGDPVVAWTADDFRQCAVELVELAESWRIDAHSKHAASGKLSAPVVAEIARGAAFPPASKKSLSNSSPATLAKMFNSLKVPIAMKSVVSTAPALVYLVVRDLQTSARIEKLIAENKKET